MAPLPALRWVAPPTDPPTSDVKQYPTTNVPAFSLRLAAIMHVAILCGTLLSLDTLSQRRLMLAIFAWAGLEDDSVEACGRLRLVFRLLCGLGSSLLCGVVLPTLATLVSATACPRAVTRSRSACADAAIRLSSGLASLALGSALSMASEMAFVDAVRRDGEWVAFLGFLGAGGVSSVLAVRLRFIRMYTEAGEAHAEARTAASSTITTGSRVRVGHSDSP